MTTVTLHPGTVTVTGTNVVDPKTVTGSGAVWDDGSDSTYSTVYTSYNGDISGSAFQDWSQAPLDVLTLPAGATVNSITLNYRLSSPIASPQSQAALYLSIRDSADNDLFQAPPPILIAPTATQSLSYSVPSGSLSALAASLATPGCQVFAACFSRTGDFPSTYHYAVRVYEASVVVDYTGATPTTTVASPRRLTNRDDMFASARRLTGSRSRQGGNRLTGYL